MTIDDEKKDPDWWNFDGSSTGQAEGSNSEVMLRPIHTYRDPFRRGNNILVLCDTYVYNKGDRVPHQSNKRAKAHEIFERAKVKNQDPWFGLEQEYTLFESNNRTPLGWPVDGFPEPQGPFYCGIGTRNAYGRYIAEAHYKACLYAGLKIAGINGEVMPGQWEFQIGIAQGIEAADHLWVARYLLGRVCEDFGVCVSYDAKPVTGDWNGAGCHTNYSTIDTRKDGGYEVIKKMMTTLEAMHVKFMQQYGEGNSKRLTGRHETSAINKFTNNVGSRTSSVRIPTLTAQQNKGYFEDRRPASSMDPYVVTRYIAQATIEGTLDEEIASQCFL